MSFISQSTPAYFTGKLNMNVDNGLEAGGKIALLHISSVSSAWTLTKKSLSCLLILNTEV